MADNWKQIKKASESIKSNGYGVIKGMYDTGCDYDDEYDNMVPEKWDVLKVWCSCGSEKLVMAYDYKKGNAYFFIKERFEELKHMIIPKRVKAYDVVDVHSYLRDSRILLKKI